MNAYNSSTHACVATNQTYNASLEAASPDGAAACAVDATCAADAELIVSTMRDLEFRPSTTMHADVVEFYKDYAEGVGDDDDNDTPIGYRHHRVHLFFDKPVVGNESPRFANIVVTTQATLRPEEVLLAPACARTDLEVAIRALHAMVGRIPTQSVVTRVCGTCSKASAEFYVVNEDVVCTACVEARCTT